MLLRAFKIVLLVPVLIFLTSCSKPAEEAKSEMLIYCGITMIKPIKAFVKRFEEQPPVHITISQAAYNNSVYLTTDSRRLFEALKLKNADITLNWYASGTWEGHKEFMDIIDLPVEIAKPNELQLNALTFSKNSDLVKKFMAFAVSEEGIKIFYDYGFSPKQSMKRL